MEGGISAYETRALRFIWFQGRRTTTTSEYLPSEALTAHVLGNSLFKHSRDTAHHRSFTPLAPRLPQVSWNSLLGRGTIKNPWKYTRLGRRTKLSQKLIFYLFYFLSVFGFNEFPYSQVKYFNGAKHDWPHSLHLMSCVFNKHLNSNPLKPACYKKSGTIIMD